MEGKVFIKIISVCLTLLLSCNLVPGLNFKNCQNEQSKQRLQRNLNCFVEPQNKYLEKILNWNKENIFKIQSEKDFGSSWCMFAEQSICFILSVETCFETKWLALISELVSISTSNCSDESMTKARLKLISKESETTLKEMTENLARVLILDDFKKPCSQKSKYISDIETVSCVKLHLHSLWQFQDSRTTFLDQPTFNSTCEIVERILDSCFQSHACYYESEMTLIREIAYNIYVMYMEGLLQLTARFGSYQNAMQHFKVLIPDASKESAQNSTSDIVFNLLQKSKKQQTAYIELTDFAIEDYKTPSCKARLKKFAIQVVQSEQLSPKWFTVPLIALALILICFLLIPCRNATHK